VVTTTSPAEVLNLLKGNQDFHFVLLDFLLDPSDPSRKQGLDLLPKIREIDNDLPIIVLTGYSDFDYAKVSIDHQVSGYIVKPFDVKELLAIIERVARRKGFLVDGEEAFQLAVGKTLRELRKRHNLTLKQTARRTSMSTAMLSMIERGEATVTLNALYRLAIAFGVKITDLFDGG
jgi:YesN/AraC family two-component response regulator